MTSIQVNSKFEWRKWPLKSISTCIQMHFRLRVIWCLKVGTYLSNKGLLTYSGLDSNLKRTAHLGCSCVLMCVQSCKFCVELSLCLYVFRMLSYSSNALYGTHKEPFSKWILQSGWFYKTQIGSVLSGLNKIINRQFAHVENTTSWFQNSCW